MTTTPPPPEVFCPGAPRAGPKFDPPHHYNVHSGRGRANGLNGAASRKRADRTPSPVPGDSSFASIDSEAPNELKRTPRPKRMRTPDDSVTRASHFSASIPKQPFFSPHMSASGKSTMASKPRSAAKSEMHAEVDLAAASAAHSILPTPTKTPRKQVLHPESAEAVRTLFPQDKAAADAMMTPSKPDLSHLPTPVSKKRGKRMRKNVGFSLDEDEGAADIEIYTDSKEKVPELDDSPNNPFYERPGETKTYRKCKTKPEVEGHVKRGIELLKTNRGYYAVNPRQTRSYVKLRADFDDIPTSPLLATDEQKKAYLELQNLTSDDDISELDADPSEPLHAHQLQPVRLIADELGPSTRATVTDDDDDHTTLLGGINGATPVAKHKRVHKLLDTVFGIDADADTDVTSSTDKSGSLGFGGAPATGSARKPIDLTKSPFDAWPRRKGSRSRAGGANGKTVAAAAPVLEAVARPIAVEEVAEAVPAGDAAAAAAEEEDDVAVESAASSFASRAGASAKREGAPLAASASKRLRGN